MEVNEEKVIKFVSLYLRAMTVAANEGKLRWAKSPDDIAKYVQNAVVGLATKNAVGQSPDLKGEALQSVLKELKIKPTYKAIAAWFTE